MNRVDKGLVKFKGRPLIECVINALHNQVDDIVISANRNLELYKQFSPTVVPDDNGKFGPLSGMAAALPACKHEWVLVVPCDMPYLPNDLVEKLLTNENHNQRNNITIVDVKHHFQLVFLMNKSLLPSVLEHLSSEKHKLMQWVKSCSPAIVDYSNSADSFININAIEELD